MGWGGGGGGGQINGEGGGVAAILQSAPLQPESQVHVHVPLTSTAVPRPLQLFAGVQTTLQAAPLHPALQMHSQPLFAPFTNAAPLMGHVEARQE